MMRYLLLGALLGLLLVFPQLLTVVGAILAAALSEPVLVAFALGLAAGARASRPRRWSR